MCVGVVLGGGYDLIVLGYIRKQSSIKRHAARIDNSSSKWTRYAKS